MNDDDVISASITTDANGWFQAVSPSFLMLIDRKVEALAGLNLIDLVHPHDAANVRRAIHDASTTGVDATATTRLFGAGERWYDIDATLQPQDNGHVTIGLAVLDDTSNAVPTAAVSDPAFLPDDPFTVGEPVPAVVARVRATPTRTTPTTTVSADQNGQRFPGPEVPMQRAAIRTSAGAAATPMIEIDAEGRTTFVSGPWDSLCVDRVESVPAFEHVLHVSGQSNNIAEAMGKAFDDGLAGRLETTLPGVGRRYVQVLPIPSPHVHGQMHALIAVTPQPELGELDVTPVEPPPMIASSPVPPSAIAALTRVTSTVSTEGPTAVSAATGAVATQQQLSAETHDPAPVAATDSELSPGWAHAQLTSIKEWLDRRDLSYGQLGAALGVVVIAAVLRFWDLAAIPTGFHGDEAITGQEAQRVLENGSIGVYTGSALGQPTGPFYLYAIGVGLFGNTVWATRSIAALGGIVAVGLVYLIVQKRFDHRTAVAAAVAMAMMTWTLHFSRIAFGIAWWPVVVLAAIAAVDRATTHMTARSWFGAGAIVTLGIYVYNSHITFGAAVALFGVIWLATKSRSLGAAGVKALVFAPLGAFVVAIPMITYALDETNGFSNHFTLLSRRNTDEWIQASFFGKVELFAGWYIDAWDALLVHPVSDGVDAAGVIKQVPWVFTILAMIGLVQVLRKHRTAFAGLLLVTLAVLPIAPALTFNAQTRRDFGMAPALAILAGIGAVALLTFIGERLKLRNTNGIAVALVATVFFTSTIPYFTTFRNDTGQKWIFANELTVAAEGVLEAEADRPVFVNWYSGRHYFDYPTLNYLLEDVPGTNRAPLDQGFDENPSLALTEDVAQDQVYVFIGDYANNLEQLRTMYPQGRLLRDTQGPRVVVYEVPAPTS